MIKLYWHPLTRSIRVLWMLEEIGAPYELVDIDIRDDSARANPAFLATSPMGKVPAIEDGDTRMAESAAICLYLADRFPAKKLSPAIDDPQRGKFLYWMFFTPAVIEPAAAEKFSGREVNRFSNAWGDFELMIETLEKGLGEGPWLLGDQFSAADLLVGGAVAFLQQANALPENKTLAAYADRCRARPAHQRAEKIESGKSS